MAKPAPSPFTLPELHALPPFTALREIAIEFGVVFTLFGGAASRCAMYLYYDPSRAFDLFDLTPFTSDIDLAHSGSSDQTVPIKSAIFDRVTFATWCRWSIIDAKKWEAVQENIARGVQVPLRQITLHSTQPAKPSLAALNDLEQRCVSWERRPGFDETSFARQGRTLEVFGLMMAINIVADMHEIAGSGALTQLEAAINWLIVDARVLQERGRLSNVDGDEVREARLSNRAFQIWANRHARGYHERIDQALSVWLEAADILPDQLPGGFSEPFSSALTVSKLAGATGTRVPQKAVEYVVGVQARDRLNERLAQIATLMQSGQSAVVDPIYEVIAYIPGLTISASAIEVGESSPDSDAADDVYGSLPNGEFLHLTWPMPRNSSISGVTGFLLPHDNNPAEIARMAHLPTPFAIGGSFDGRHCWLRIDIEAIALLHGKSGRDINVDIVVLTPFEDRLRLEESFEQSSPPDFFEAAKSQLSPGGTMA